MDVEILPILGKTLTSIVVKRNYRDDDEILFHTSDGLVYRMYHMQDCCECVEIEDINGDINDLIESPLTMAESVSEENPDATESGTWTFYKFASVKGYVTIRWYGASNGFYSESVSFIEVR